jgi:hypothetical protein
MTVQPGVGHLHPMAPLARSLAVDHEVLVASSAGFLPRIERFGLRAIPIGVDWTQATATQTLPGFVESDGFGQLRLYASRLAGPAASDLLEVASTWRPDLILRDATDFGAWVAGEKLNIPTAAFGMMIRTVGPLLVHAAGPELAAVRQDFGLPPDPELASFGGALYIDAVPPFFTPADWPAPQSLMHVRPPLLDRSDDAVAPSWVDDLGSPLVLMTLGTVFNDARLVQLAVDACVSLDVDLVVTLGETGDPGAFGALPPRVRVERYVPHSLLLPRCSALISHAASRPRRRPSITACRRWPCPPRPISLSTPGASPNSAWASTSVRQNPSCSRWSTRMSSRQLRSVMRLSVPCSTRQLARHPSKRNAHCGIYPASKRWQPGSSDSRRRPEGRRWPRDHAWLGARPVAHRCSHARLEVVGVVAVEHPATWVVGDEID